MRFRLIASVLLAGVVSVACPIDREASAQKQAPAQQAKPPTEAQPSDPAAIEDALERIARAEEAERAQREREEKDTSGADDLKAQQDMAKFASMMLVPAWVSAVAGIAAVIALLLTFRSQQRMTKSQERALLEVAGGGIWPIKKHGTDGMHIEVALENTGRTRAVSIEVRGQLVYSPEISDSGEVLGVAITEPFTLQMAEIGAGVLAVCYQWQETEIDVTEMYDRRFGSGGPTVGSELSETQRIDMNGTVTYRDIYSGKHTISFGSVFYSLETGVPNTFSQSAGGWRASDYKKRKG